MVNDVQALEAVDHGSQINGIGIYFFPGEAPMIYILINGMSHLYSAAHGTWLVHNLACWKRRSQIALQADLQI